MRLPDTAPAQRQVNRPSAIRSSGHHNRLALSHQQKNPIQCLRQMQEQTRPVIDTVDASLHIPPPPFPSPTPSGLIWQFTVLSNPPCGGRSKRSMPYSLAPPFFLSDMPLEQLEAGQDAQQLQVGGGGGDIFSACIGASLAWQSINQGKQ